MFPGGRWVGGLPPAIPEERPLEAGGQRQQPGAIRDFDDDDILSKGNEPTTPPKQKLRFVVLPSHTLINSLILHTLILSRYQSDRLLLGRRGKLGKAEGVFCSDA